MPDIVKHKVLEMNMNISFNLIRQEVERAVEIVILNDSMLICDGQERALSFRIGVYLTKLFSGWDVDSEYNRVEFDHVRKLNGLGGCSQPDLIIHKRGSLKLRNNLVWIEVKIKNNSIDEDVNVIKAFTSPTECERKVQYMYGLSLSFKPKLKYEWYTNGQSIEI
jgi:hypothetical protein